MTKTRLGSLEQLLPFTSRGSWFHEGSPKQEEIVVGYRGSNATSSSVMSSGPCLPAGPRRDRRVNNDPLFNLLSMLCSRTRLTYFHSYQGGQTSERSEFFAQSSRELDQPVGRAFSTETRRERHAELASAEHHRQDLTIQLNDDDNGPRWRSASLVLRAELLPVAVLAPAVRVDEGRVLEEPPLHNMSRDVQGWGPGGVRGRPTVPGRAGTSHAEVPGRAGTSGVVLGRPSDVQGRGTSPDVRA